MIHSSGLAIIYQKKILLVHPTGTAWSGTFSIPKGEVDSNETYLETAIRETFEEVGIDIEDDWIDKTEYVIEYKNRRKTYKKLHWFKTNISDISFSKIKYFLQLSEVDYASFMNIDDAIERIFWRQKPILEILL